MAEAAGFTAPISIEPIFVYFFEYLRSFPGNGIANVSLQMLDCLGAVGIKLFVNDEPQKIVQRCQTAAS